MIGERVRLFVALELPHGPVEALVRWRERAIGGIEGLRLLRPESLHVTLCFLGSLPDAEIPAVAAAVVAAAVEGAAPLEVALSLGAPAWLPRRRPAVLAVGIEDPSGALADMQASVAATLVAGGWYEPESRRFLAHVTVARVARGARIRAVELPAPEPFAFTGTAVTLFRSRPAPGGSRYERLSGGLRAQRGPVP
jgi:2'-5' RNA ligase